MNVQGLNADPHRHGCTGFGKMNSQSRMYFANDFVNYVLKEFLFSIYGTMK